MAKRKKKLSERERQRRLFRSYSDRMSNHLETLDDQTKDLKRELDAALRQMRLPTQS